jgi:hypothetical protein
MAPPANRGAGSAAVEPLDGDGVLLEEARERRPAGAERGGVALGMDRFTDDRSGAQPIVRLRHHFVRHHKRGIAAPASRFMRGLCHHYEVELHNFSPNAISQAATFVDVCEGFLGIPVNWDL